MTEFAQAQIKGVPGRVEKGTRRNNAMLKALCKRMDGIINDMEAGKTMHGIESLKEFRDMIRRGNFK